MRNNKTIDWLLVLPSDYLGGSEQLLYNLTDYLCNEKLKCMVIILSKKDTGLWTDLETKCTVKYLPFRNTYLGFLYLIPVLIKYSIQYNIKHTLTSQTLINGLLGFTKNIGCFKNTKMIVRESTSVFHALKRFKLKMYTVAYKIGYSKVDLVICQTEFMKTQLLKALPWLQKQVDVVVLPNPINLEIVHKMSKEKMAETFEIKNNEFLVAAGRLIAIKGYDILIKAFSEILTDFPNLRLVILGEGKQREHLEELIETLGLDEKVFLIGQVKNVYPYFNSAKVCVVSSRVEGFPNVLLQMMSQNSKVVSTLCAGGIEHIEGIFKCEPNDVNSLRAAISKCLESDTISNRQIFDRYLQERTIHNFISTISNKMVR